MYEHIFNRNTILFLVAIAIGGTLYLALYSAPGVWSSILFCLLSGIYLSLILLWMLSIRKRLLPSRAKQYMSAAAWLMLFFLLVRTFKYGLMTQDDQVGLRWLWYLYYVSTLFVPTLFLMLCVGAYRQTRQGRKRLDELWLLTIPCALLALVLTNDLHHFVFVPIEGVPFSPQPQTYTYGAGFWIISFVCVATPAVGLFLLIRLSRRTHDRQKAILPFALTVLCALMLGAVNLIEASGARPPFRHPEVSVFGMMAVLESCIRTRLIPYNYNYAGYFADLRLNAAVADRSFTPVYSTKSCVLPDEELLAQSLDREVAVDRDHILHGQTLSSEAGYVFYIEDETDLHRLNERLAKANHTIRQENEVIAKQLQLRKERSNIDARNRIYARLEEQMLPTQRKITRLLAQARPDTPEFADSVAQVLPLMAFLKRGSDLLLAAAERDGIGATDLMSALRETARYYAYKRLTVGVGVVEPITDGKEAFDLLSAFVALCEAMPTPCRVSVAYCEGVMRIGTDCRAFDLPDAPLPVERRQDDGIWYLYVSGKGERV